MLYVLLEMILFIVFGSIIYSKAGVMLTAVR